MIFIVSVFTPWRVPFCGCCPLRGWRSQVPCRKPVHHSDNSRRYQHADEQCHGDVSQADDHRLAQKRHAGLPMMRRLME